MLTEDEIKAHIQAADAVLGNEYVKSAIEEFAFNMGIPESHHLATAGLMKIAYYAALVSRANSLNLDIEDFK